MKVIRTIRRTTRLIFRILLVGASALLVLGATLAFATYEQMSSGYWLAEAMYFEAREEPPNGRAAVASVILNRIDDPRWPNTVENVVRYRERGNGRLCDFSYRCDGKSDNPWLHSKKHHSKWMRIRFEAWKLLAYRTLLGSWADTTGGAVYYKRFDVTSPWFEKEQRAGRMERSHLRVGAHEFFCASKRNL